MIDYNDLAEKATSRWDAIARRESEQKQQHDAERWSAISYWNQFKDCLEKETDSLNASLEAKGSSWRVERSQATGPDSARSILLTVSITPGRQQVDALSLLADASVIRWTRTAGTSDPKVLPIEIRCRPQGPMGFFPDRDQVAPWELAQRVIAKVCGA